MAGRKKKRQKKKDVGNRALLLVVIVLLIIVVLSFLLVLNSINGVQSVPKTDLTSGEIGFEVEEPPQIEPTEVAEIEGEEV